MCRIFKSSLSGYPLERGIIVPILINFRKSVPIPINFNSAEIGAILTPPDKKKTKVRIVQKLKKKGALLESPFFKKPAVATIGHTLRTTDRS